MKVLLSGFHLKSLNGHTLEFRLQTRKLEAP